MLIKEAMQIILDTKESGAKLSLHIRFLHAFTTLHYNLL